MILIAGVGVALIALLAAWAHEREAIMVVDAAQAHQEWIGSEVLARSMVVGDAAQQGQQAMDAVDLDGLTARIALTKED